MGAFLQDRLSPLPKFWAWQGARSFGKAHRCVGRACLARLVALRRWAWQGRLGVHGRVPMLPRLVPIGNARPCEARVPRLRWLSHFEQCELGIGLFVRP